ncbi:MAG: FAD-binding oxidoreductase [Candidatus Aminicenantaceae bacterium]
MYKKINEKIIDEIEKIVGRKNIIIESEKLLDYSHDEFSLTEIAKEPELVVKPEKAEDVSAIIKLANREMIPVTPRGGATGLCGGCVPLEGGIVVSLENMNRVVEIDKDNQMAVVEAGVNLMDFYREVENSGLFFPPHPGEESAMIGGVISTNAGGSRAVKYGVIRNYVRGLEIVLASGEIITLGGKIMKSSTGYNLLNLIIGSEGTLGIITKAIINLLPQPQVIRSLIIPYDDLEKAIETVPLLSGKKILPMAVEFMEREVIVITERYLKMKWPCSEGKTYLLIILDASSYEEMDMLSEAVGEVCMDKGACDVFVADTPKKQENVLEIRSKIYEAIKAHTIEVLDITVPRAEIPSHVKNVHKISQKYNIWLPTFGHAADGNVHTHIMKARFVDGSLVPVQEEEWREKFEEVRRELYKDCKKRGGVISGEHGIGFVKKRFLPYIVGKKQVELMKGIKRLFDPQNILNPHKIFD